MKLITLAKRLDFTTENEYFDYCLDSYTNGNYSQCKNLFRAMTKNQKKQLINYLKQDVEWMEAEQFYFNLL